MKQVLLILFVMLFGSLSSFAIIDPPGDPDPITGIGVFTIGGNNGDDNDPDLPTMIPPLRATSAATTYRAANNYEAPSGIQFNFSTNIGRIQIEICNSYGLPVYQNIVLATANSNITVNTSKWRQGTYTIVIKLNGGESKIFTYVK